jgi:hypothetical protein
MNKRIFNILIFCAIIFWINPVLAQPLRLSDPWFALNAGPDDPTFTTYAATMERSTLYGDMAYKMVHYKNGEPLYYEKDHGGRMFNIWRVNEIAIINSGEYYQRPTIYCSFPDMVVTEYMPIEGLKVQETFLVYSSSASVVHMHIENVSDRELEVVVFPLLTRLIPLHLKGTTKQTGFTRPGDTNPISVSSATFTSMHHTQSITPIFLLSDFKPYSYGGYKGNMRWFYNTIKVNHYIDDKYNDTLNLKTDGMVDFMTLHHKMVLKPGQTADVRYIRGSADAGYHPMN